LVWQGTTVSALRRKLAELRRGHRNGPHAHCGGDHPLSSRCDRRGEPLHARSLGRAGEWLRDRCRSVPHRISPDWWNSLPVCVRRHDRHAHSACGHRERNIGARRALGRCGRTYFRADANVLDEFRDP
jgi:hypothetical protein